MDVVGSSRFRFLPHSPSTSLDATFVALEVYLRNVDAYMITPCDAVRALSKHAETGIYQDGCITV